MGAQNIMTGAGVKPGPNYMVKTPLPRKKKFLPIYFDSERVKFVLWSLVRKDVFGAIVVKIYMVSWHFT